MKNDPSYLVDYQRRFRNFQLWYQHVCRGQAQRSLRQLTEMEMNDIMLLRKEGIPKKHRQQLHDNKRFYKKARRVIATWQREYDLGFTPTWRGDEHLFTKSDPE